MAEMLYLTPEDEKRLHPEASNNPVINTTIGLSPVKFQVKSLLPMHRIGLLLKNVHQRQVAQAKQEQRERDEEENRGRQKMLKNWLCISWGLA